MDRSTIVKILDAQERLYRDPDYQDLWVELQAKNREFQKLMDVLPQQQRAIVDDYTGILHELQGRLLCYAAERTE